MIFIFAAFRRRNSYQKAFRISFDKFRTGVSDRRRHLSKKFSLGRSNGRSGAYTARGGRAKRHSRIKLAPPARPKRRSRANLAPLGLQSAVPRPIRHREAAENAVQILLKHSKTSACATKLQRLLTRSSMDIDGAPLLFMLSVGSHC